MYQKLIAYLLLLVLLTISVEAKIPGGFTEIRRFNINSEGGVIYLGTYGFDVNGVCRVEILHNITKVDEDTPSHVGFFLAQVQNANQARIQRHATEKSLCDTPSVTLNGGLNLVLKGIDGTGRYNATANITNPGFYALYFYNCFKKEIDLSATIIRYNQYPATDSTGNIVINYLQVGDMPKPILYLFFLVVYIILISVWVTLQVRAQPQNRYKIHYVMTLLLVFYWLCIVMQLAKYRQFQIYGMTSEVIHGFYGLFLILRGLILVCGIVLLGTGWSVLKPHLGNREKKVMAIILPLQLISNIAQVVLEELSEGDETWTQWRDTLRIFDLICCCVVLLPVIWSIKMLNESSNRDGKVIANIVRLKQFRALYVLLVVYIYYTRIIVVIVDDSLHYKWGWISTMLKESGTAIFFLYVGVRFQPCDQNPYLQLNLEDLHDEAIQNELAFSNDPHEGSLNEVVTTGSASEILHARGPRTITVADDDE